MHLRNDSFSRKSFFNLRPFENRQCVRDAKAVVKNFSGTEQTEQKVIDVNIDHID